MVDEHRSPLDQALDLLVFAPVGLVLTAKDELPNLVHKGRQRLGNQLVVARMVGQFAVTQGQKEAEKAAARLVEQAGTVASRLGGFPGVPGPTGGATTAPAAAGAPRPTVPYADGAAGKPNGAAPGNGRRPSNGRTAPSPRAARSGTATRTRGPQSAGLAIPGYDSLSASQVVQRLAGLTDEELEAVRSYESATRGRRTILSKVAQLQSDRR